MAGGLWEWCADAYAPLDFLPAGSGVASPQRSVRGGSWANPGKMPIGTRAGLEPAVGAPFVGFRPVIAAAIAP
jgi:formylglycine-generating enzyme required for sulfatase activity